ncbi:hypothetical protein B0J12DRAFT_124018 [Macrophomina phaseolina]|uniref:Secreted protein n=1 Tax=Macrophomina phaseolina TaxID=35725 RepID=A0ABQ8G7W3_9PEZI|nr:hypothetical protein B0J12DRAFT_124018 [Macrophomina phaseolina]
MIACCLSVIAIVIIAMTRRCALTRLVPDSGALCCEGRQMLHASFLPLPFLPLLLAGRGFIRPVAFSLAEGDAYLLLFSGSCVCSAAAAEWEYFCSRD